VGGLIALGFGFLIGKKMHDWNQIRLDHKFEQLKTGHPSAGGAV
jgi:hypothetical protein